MNIFFLAMVSVFVTSLISFTGALILSVGQQKIKDAMLYLISFAAGALLGNAFLDLIPYALSKDPNSWLFNSFAILVGILFFFILEAFLHWHHQHFVPYYSRKATYGLMNLIGDGIHNFVDGVVIAGSFLVSMELGLTTTVAVILHEIPQEISDFGILLHAGYSTRKALFYNFLSALTAILGALFVFVFKKTVLPFQFSLLAFTAGGFIYIACCDLIPELHKTPQKLSKSLFQFLWLIMGTVIMLALQIIM